MTFKAADVFGNNLDWLDDGNDETCNNKDSNSLTVTLEKPIPLTWIRVVLKSDGKSLLFV